MSVNNPNFETIGSATGTIFWDVVVEDAAGMYNPLTGEATIPEGGLWSIEARVSIDQDAMTGFPAAYYQHILAISKSIPFPDGFTIRFIDFFQERLATPGLTRQVMLQGNETIRLTAGDRVQIQVFTTILSPITPVDTDISGTVCLNCWTMTRLGD